MQNFHRVVVFRLNDHKTPPRYICFEGGVYGKLFVSIQNRREKSWLHQHWKQTVFALRIIQDWFFQSSLQLYIHDDTDLGMGAVYLGALQARLCYCRALGSIPGASQPKGQRMKQLLRAKIVGTFACYYIFATGWSQPTVKELYLTAPRIIASILLIFKG
jgi:hypothetical protein